MVADTVSTRALRDAFGTFATGVTVITGHRPDGRPVGITVNSFTSVSLDPPLILWCIARDSGNAVAFNTGAHFAVTVLGEAEKDVALHFAARSASKFPDGAVAGPQGPSPAVPRSHPCRLDCTVEALHEAGDHLIVVGRVHAIDRKGGRVLAFHDGRFGAVTVDALTPKVDLWDRTEINVPPLLRAPFD